MAKKPAKRTVRQKADEAVSNPLVKLVNMGMNIIGTPAIALAAAGWIYHSIDDLKTGQTKLETVVAEQHSGVEGEIQGLRNWLSAVGQQVSKWAKP